MSDADITVAKRVVTELVRIGFLKPERADRFAADLSAGRMKAEEWKLLADPPHHAGADDAE